MIWGISADYLLPKSVFPVNYFLSLPPLPAPKSNGSFPSKFSPFFVPFWPNFDGLLFYFITFYSSVPCFFTLY